MVDAIHPKIRRLRLICVIIQEKHYISDGFHSER